MNMYVPQPSYLCFCRPLTARASTSLKTAMFYLEGRQFSLITNKLSLLFYIVKACIKRFVVQMVALAVMKMCTFSFFYFVLCH